MPDAIIYLVLFVHVIADFVLQTDKMAKNKSTSFAWLSNHVAVYSLPFAVIFGWKYALVNGVAHFFVDAVTSRLSSYQWKAGKTHNFFVVIGFDQYIHTVTLIYTIPMIDFWWLR